MGSYNNSTEGKETEVTYNNMKSGVEEKELEKSKEFGRNMAASSSIEANGMNVLTPGIPGSILGSNIQATNATMPIPNLNTSGAFGTAQAATTQSTTTLPSLTFHHPSSLGSSVDSVPPLQQYQQRQRQHQQHFQLLSTPTVMVGYGHPQPIQAFNNATATTVHPPILIQPISTIPVAQASSLDSTAVNLTNNSANVVPSNFTTPAHMAVPVSVTQQQPTLSTNTCAATTTPRTASIALQPQVQPIAKNSGINAAILPQQHQVQQQQQYIPPILAPIPLPNQTQTGLTVQDHPYKNPIYNGVNPNYPNLQVLNQNPPVFTVSNFLSPTECDFLINVAQDCFSPAPVVGKGAGEVSPSRTSSTCYLAREDLPRYLQKVSSLTGKPIEHCELPQVGRYFPSQQYLQHFDAFDLSDEDGIRFASNGGQRTVTVLVYLNDVNQGGETWFPNLNLSVKPKRGMALVFFPSTVDGLLDKNALHAAKPAIDVKYVSQVWIRQGRYDGLPSKRMFSSVDQALIVQKSLIVAREGEDAVKNEYGFLNSGIATS